MSKPMSEPMSEHKAVVEWQRSGAFERTLYSRVHTMRFDSGIRIAGNAAPGNIPATVPAAPGVDPEQAFVAALSACHMLWFLDRACKAGHTVDRYTDNASGRLERNAAGKMAITLVTLRPAVEFGTAAPSAVQLRALHDDAHEHCFIANSVSSQIDIEPQ